MRGVRTAFLWILAGSAAACGEPTPAGDGGPSDGEDLPAESGREVEGGEVEGGEGDGEDPDALDEAGETDRDGDGDTPDGGEEGDGGGDDDGSGPEFVPLVCPTGPEPDVRTHRLCDEAADPAGAPDKVRIHCRVESACFAPADPPPTGSLRVVAWNIERGLRLDAQLAWLTSDPAAPRPDVVLLTEVDRGCSRTGFRHVFLEYARALAMDGAYGVEFVELPREGGPGGTLETVCEHGNAILSRYPIGNLEVLRHADQRSWYEGDEPRLGGRVAVAADVAVGGQRLRLYAVHYESGALDGPLRAAQAAETADHALAVGHTALVGGDMNAGTYAADLLFGTATDRTAGAFLERGFTDAHAALPYARRITHDPALVLDLIMGTSTAFRDSDVCPTATCRSLSDHNAVWTTLDL